VEIRLRLAKPSDAKQIAAIQYSMRKSNDLGIFSQMDRFFLVNYYKIVLNDPWEVVVCAENEQGKIVGFNSSTLDASKQMETFRKHKLRLGLASLTSILRNPRLLNALLVRYKSTNKDNDFQFVFNRGARGEFWAWKPNERNPEASVEMNAAYRAVLRALGVKEVFYEVDAANKKIVAYHKLNKDEIIETIILPDGRKRYLMRSDLTRKGII
jgi:hypothetical protein